VKAAQGKLNSFMKVKEDVVVGIPGTLN